jgi:hypothetical protein
MEGNRSYALLIGVGKRAEDAPGMAISADDAKNMGLALQQYCQIPREQNFLLTGKEASRENILKTFESIAIETKEQQADTVVIYFSGHGCNVQGNLYFVTHDSRNTDIPGTAIAGNEWINLLKECKANKMLVILDCCHAGAFTQMETHKWQSVGVPFDAEAFVSGKNRVVLTASHASQVSYLSRPVSVFTYALIEALGGGHFYVGDKNVTLFDLALYVRERVVFLSKQLNNNKPQKPSLTLLEKSATENFVLARYPRGKGEPFAFAEPFTSLSMDDGAKALLVEGLDEDKYYRELLSQVFQINITGDGNMVAAAGPGSTVNQTKINQLVNNYYNGPQNPSPLIVGDIQNQPLFTENEIKRLSPSRATLEGFIHIKNNDTIYLRLPGQLKPFTYKLQGERFSSQIIDLLQRISYEDILRDPEFELLGMSLFNRLFPGEDIKIAFQDFFNSISKTEMEKLRFVFQFDKYSLQTAFIPWEYLYFQPNNNQQGFFFWEQFAITRKLEDANASLEKDNRLSELNILFALSPFLKNSSYEDKIPPLLEDIDKNLQGKIRPEVKFLKNLEDLKMEMLSRHYHVVHLVGVAKVVSKKDKENSFVFGFLQNDKESSGCSAEWIDVGNLQSLMSQTRPSFVFFHPCKVPESNLLENRNEQNFIAMTGLAFHLSAIIPGAIALQTTFESVYTFSFLKYFYNEATKGVELYRAVHESLINLTKSGFEDKNIPRNRVLGMSALFSDLSGKFEFINTAPTITEDYKNTCPNYNEFIKAKCTEEFLLDDTGQPAGYRCPSCKKQRMYCKNKACGKLIDQVDIAEKVCSHCGKNPHEEVEVTKDNKQSPEKLMTVEGLRPQMYSGVVPGPSTDRTSPFSIKINRP